MTTVDLIEVEQVFTQAFSIEEASATYQIIRASISNNTPDTRLCLGYEKQTNIVGAIAFTSVVFEPAEDMTGYILAPLAVHSDYQQQGIGTKLIEYGLEHLIAQGVEVVLVYGDPEYYGRFGFDVELGRHFRPPYALEYELGWQAMQLGTLNLRDRIYPFRCVDELSDPTFW